MQIYKKKKKNCFSTVHNISTEEGVVSRVGEAGKAFF